MPLVILGVVGVLAALGVLAFFLLSDNENSSSKVLTEVVVRGDFIHDVVEAGEVESSENIELRCEVKSRNAAGTTIISVVPEGDTVRGPHTDEDGNEVSGDIVVQLDSSALELELQQEEITLNNKRSARDQAGNLLNAARSALREYVGVTEYAKIMGSKEETKDSPVSPSNRPAESGDDSESISAAAVENSLVGAGTETTQGDSPAVEASLQSAPEEASPLEVTLAEISSSDDDSNGSYHVEENLVLAEKFVAEENKRRAQQYWQYSLNLAKKGIFTQQQLASDHFALLKAEKDLEAAKIKLSVLQNHTKRKIISQLLSDINNAEAVYLAEENSVKVQEDRVREIKDQIKKCTIHAPQDGIVVHANERDRRGNSEFVVEPGSVVRERQVIVRLPNSDQMQVRAKVSESKIAYLDSDKPLKASVTIDAFNGMNLEGQVTKVNDYPEPTSWFSSTVKEYVAYVKILNPPPSLKSGLTAKVRIHAQHLEDVVQVSVQSVHRHRGRYYCFVKDGKHWRVQPVTLGPSNDKQVVIQDGLTAGQIVALDPASLLEVVNLPDTPEPGKGRKQMPSGEAPADGASDQGPAANFNGESPQGHGANANGEGPNRGPRPDLNGQRPSGQGRPNGQGARPNFGGERPRPNGATGEARPSAAGPNRQRDAQQRSD